MLPLPGQRVRAEERRVMLDLIVEAQTAGLPSERAYQDLGLSPRSALMAFT